MPAQRGQVFAAIYQVSPTCSGLLTVVADTVMTPETWQQTLASWSTPYHLIQAPDELGTSVSSLLELAYLDWQRKASRLVKPCAYGQHP